MLRPALHAPPVGDHWRYCKVLPDGTVLRTKVSHALGDEIRPDLLSHIVRDQLRTTMQHFRGVLAGVRAAKRWSPINGRANP